MGVTRRDEAGEEHSLLEYYLGGKRRLPLLKEEFWQDAAGRVTRYSLAYIDPMIFSGDNGRVLGYDNAHGNTTGISWAWKVNIVSPASRMCWRGLRQRSLE